MQLKKLFRRLRRTNKVKAALRFENTMNAATSPGKRHIARGEALNQGCTYPREDMNVVYELDTAWYKEHQPVTATKAKTR